MSEPRTLKSFTVGSAEVVLLDTGHFDPSKQFAVEIKGELPSRFAGLPQATMLRIARTLAMLARQSASASYADVSQWASTLSPKKKLSSAAAAAPAKVGHAATEPRKNSAATTTARAAG